MGDVEIEVTGDGKRFTSEEEAKAAISINEITLGFSEMAAVRCAIELGIADVLEDHYKDGGASVSLNQLSSTLNCSPDLLHRLMRFLIHLGIFKQDPTTHGYLQTPLSIRLTTKGDTKNKSMAAFVMLATSSVMIAPCFGLHARVSSSSSMAPFEGVHGKDLWKYVEKNGTHSQLLNDAMACHAREVVPLIVKYCSHVFDHRIKSLVDVGGGNGTTLNLLVKAFPWITNPINFDLPHVISAVSASDIVEHVGGDMFQSVPKANAAFMMRVLHDWGDDDCICILKNCKEAITQDGNINGKVIIGEAVLLDNSGEEEDENEKRIEDIGLKLDMAMLIHTTNGKERTSKEWLNILKVAGFTRIAFNKIRESVICIIEAYP